MGHEKGALPSRTATTNLLALDEEGMGRLVQQFGWPRYRTGQILRWLYQRRAKDINQMTDLGQAERTALASLATIPRATGCKVFRSIDHTRKLVLTLNDGLTVKRYGFPMKALTLCVATQGGCTWVRFPAARGVETQSEATGNPGAGADAKVTRPSERLPPSIYGEGRALANWRNCKRPSGSPTKVGADGSQTHHGHDADGRIENIAPLASLCHLG